ncbi:MAG: FIST signal transduction protein [Nannocystaceae bacterium]|nr:FIST C-terminal domain-containing protein [bacterium]
MDVVSIGPVEAEPQRLSEAFSAVGDRLAGDKLGVLFAPHDADLPVLLRAASEGLGGRIVGATTGGAAFTERGFTRDGVVAAVFGGQDFAYSVATAHRASSSDMSELDAACSSLIAASRKHVARTPALIALGDGRSVDGVALTEALSRRMPPHWRVFGGAAGDSLAFLNRSRVFVDDGLDDAVVLVGMFSGSRCGVAVGHGWSAAPGARELTVTETRGHTLRTLDGEPAATVYGEELHRLGLISDASQLVPDAQRFSFGARTRFGELTIRAPLEFHDDGGIRLAGSVVEGTVLQVVCTTPDRLAASAAEVGRRALCDFAEDQVPRGGLVFDCAARLAYLGDDYAEQTRCFFEGHAFPLVGTTSYGEIAKFGGSLEGFHNATAVMAVW